MRWLSILPLNARGEKVISDLGLHNYKLFRDTLGLFRIPSQPQLRTNSCASLVPGVCLLHTHLSLPYFPPQHVFVLLLRFPSHPFQSPLFNLQAVTPFSFPIMSGTPTANPYDQPSTPIADGTASSKSALSVNKISADFIACRSMISRRTGNDFIEFHVAFCAVPIIACQPMISLCANIELQAMI